MLNAFRHQRTIHLKQTIADRISLARCSTPFGINERFTRCRYCCRHAAFVLNAFRHQRTIHPRPWPSRIERSSAQRLSASTNDSLPQPLSKTIADRMCSTPFGINERFTSRIKSFNHGSSECSTPFGINERFTRTSVTARCVLSGAQRLSASTNDSHRPYAGRCCRADVLNAFRHQRTIHRTRSNPLQNKKLWTVVSSIWAGRTTRVFIFATKRRMCSGVRSL